MKICDSLIISKYLRPILYLFGFFSLLIAGCQNGISENANSPSVVTPTETQPSLSIDSSPQTSDLPLLHSQVAIVGEIFTLEVMNEGKLTYTHYGGSDGNCLNVYDGDGNRMRIIPELTCDAFAERIIEPGKQVYIDNWDLKECIDDFCLTREPVAPGRYLVIETFYPILQGSSSIDGEVFALQADFIVQAGNY